MHRNRYDTVSPIKVSALEKKAEMKIKINRRCLASKEESFFSDIVTKQSNMLSTKENNATVTRAKANPTTDLCRLP